MPKTTIYLSRALYKTAKKHQIKFSPLLRNALLAKLDELNIELEEVDMPRLILRVKCPRCKHEQNTTTIKKVNCFKCDRSYHVYVKGGKSRIVKIVRGNMAMLHDLYNSVYK